MSNEIFFGRNSLRFLYYRYKDSTYYTVSVISITIVICLVLIFNFILPQLEQWFSIRNEVIATRERIVTINENINYLNSVDRNRLNEQTAVVTSALPHEKNFGGILDALSISGARSGVAFQDYSFQVGSVSSSSAEFNNAKIKGLSKVTLTVVINGTVDEVNEFLQELMKTLPLSEVISVEGATGSVTVAIDFYQKILPKTTLRDDQPVPRTADTNATLINQLSSWQVSPRGSDADFSQVGSNSAIPLF